MIFQTDRIQTFRINISVGINNSTNTREATEIGLYCRIRENSKSKTEYREV